MSNLLKIFSAADNNEKDVQNVNTQAENGPQESSDDPYQAPFYANPMEDPEVYALYQAMFEGMCFFATL